MTQILSGEHWRLYVGDNRESMAQWPDEFVHSCVTSPPYFSQREYATGENKHLEIGRETSIQEYIDGLLSVFREVKRILRSDACLYVNIADKFADDSKWGGRTGGKHVAGLHGTLVGRRKVNTGIEAGNQCLIPHRFAMAMQGQGWVLRQTNIWCISGGAWVYARTQKGDMPMMVKDLCRLSPSTVKLWNGSKWTQVLGWGRSTDTSHRIELVLRSGERIGCTGGHLWPTSRGNVCAKDLRVGDVIQTCVIPEPDECSRPPYLTDDLLWLIGLYLAEGCQNGEDGRKLSLGLSPDEEHWIPRIASVCRHYGGTCCGSIYGGTLQVVLYGRVLSTIIRHFIRGSCAHDKHFDVRVWMLPNRDLKLLIEGYLDGDGHHDKGNGRWRLGFCRNYSLERDLRIAAARLGATITLKPSMESYQGGKKKSFRGEWRWSRSGHLNEKDRGEIIELRASRARQFWDISVEDDPHLFSLASGVLTHNCKRSPLPESVFGWRWSRCRVKIKAACTPRRDGHHSEGYDEFRHVPVAKHPKTEWELCPGCKKCEPNGGYVLRRGRGRTTTAHEYVFMFTKSNEYFYDSDTSAEPLKSDPKSWGRHSHKDPGMQAVDPRAMFGDSRNGRDGTEWGNGQTKNQRSVWSISSEQLKAKHFAAFPSELVRRCLSPSISLAGCCAECGSQYAPVIESERVATRPARDTKVDGQDSDAIGNRDPERHVTKTRILEYRPTCQCGAPKSRPICFDPFLGSGTTGRVALAMGASFVGCELSETYARDIAEPRLNTPWVPKPQKKKAKVRKPVAIPDRQKVLF